MAMSLSFPSLMLGGKIDRKVIRLELLLNLYLRFFYTNTMIKAILLDADGVAITPHPYFSQRLQDDFGIPVENVLPFFKGEFKLCTVGQADLKQEISKYFPAWGWNKSVDELFDIWFSGEEETDDDVLRTVDELRLEGIKCYLASDNEKYRARYILNDMGLGKHFDKAFFSCDLGYTKSDQEFFENVIADVKLQPKEILYLDDDPKNIEIAKMQGINSIIYKNIESLRNAIQELIKLEG